MQYAKVDPQILTHASRVVSDTPPGNNITEKRQELQLVGKKTTSSAAP